jgi:SAM-dependent methyltransferase
MISPTTEQAIRRHDVDAPIFQARYALPDKYANAFVYGRASVREEIDRLLKLLRPGAHVLDIGSGTGHLTDYIRQQTFQVSGVEPSTEMLRLARQNFPEIRFIEGYSSALPFADSTVDAIICVEVLRYIDAEEIRKSYAEMLRVLRRGGRVLVTHVNTWSTEGFWLWYQIQRLMAKLRKRPIHGTHFTRACIEERAFARAGFVNICSVGRISASIRIAYKLGVGKTWARIMEAVDPNQRSTGGLWRNMRGHLIITAQKPR